LNCPSCNRETKGIKLNGKIFCNYCGEVIKSSADILEDAYKKQMPVQDSSKQSEFNQKNPPIKPEINLKPTAKRTRAIKEAKEISLLKAEGEILELIKNNSLEPRKEEKSDLKIVNKEIIKQNRNRTGMRVFKNEPDPITFPEIEPPHDIQIEQSLETPEKIDPKPAHHVEKDQLPQKTKVLPEPIKERRSLEESLPNSKEDFVETIDDKPELKQTRKKDKQKDKKTKIALIALASLLIVVVSLGGLVFYVNSYAKNETYILNRIEGRTEFEHKKIKDIPPGFELSYLSRSAPNWIEYKYLKFDESESIVFRANQGEASSEEIFEKFISPKNEVYFVLNMASTEIWILAEKTALFNFDSVFYELYLPNKKTTSDFEEIIEGIIN